MQLAVDCVEPGVISTTHASFVQAQVTNAQDIFTIAANIAAAQPAEETTADIRKHLNRINQEYNIAMKHSETAEM